MPDHLDLGLDDMDGRYANRVKDAHVKYASVVDALTGRIPGRDVPLTLMGLYDDAYGIRSDFSETYNTPMSDAIMRQSETLDRISPYMRSMQEYITSGVYAAFGLNYHDYINQPGYLARMMIRVAKHEQAIKLKGMELPSDKK